MKSLQQKLMDADFVVQVAKELLKAEDEGFDTGDWRPKNIAKGKLKQAISKYES